MELNLCIEKIEMRSDLAWLSGFCCLQLSLYFSGVWRKRVETNNKDKISIQVYETKGYITIDWEGGI